MSSFFRKLEFFNFSRKFTFFDFLIKFKFFNFPENSFLLNALIFPIFLLYKLLVMTEEVAAKVANVIDKIKTQAKVFEDSTNQVVQDIMGKFANAQSKLHLDLSNFSGRKKRSESEGSTFFSWLEI